MAHIFLSDVRVVYSAPELTSSLAPWPTLFPHFNSSVDRLPSYDTSPFVSVALPSSWRPYFHTEILSQLPIPHRDLNFQVKTSHPYGRF
jgi:hypothetical protein